jgi:hypothetical protein
MYPRGTCYSKIFIMRNYGNSKSNGMLSSCRPSEQSHITGKATKFLKSYNTVFLNRRVEGYVECNAINLRLLGRNKCGFMIRETETRIYFSRSQY